MKFTYRDVTILAFLIRFVNGDPGYSLGVRGKIDGKWAAWTVQRTECLSSCIRISTFTRTCTNPPPQNLGMECVGRDTLSSSEKCTGNLCVTVDGKWSHWTRPLNAGKCTSKCTRKVMYTRSCTNPPPAHGKDCVGKKEDGRKELCSGDDCHIVNGGWSSWSKKPTEPCAMDCKQAVAMLRTCTNPAPSGGGHRCVGKAKASKTEACTGDACPAVDHVGTKTDNQGIDAERQTESGLNDTDIILIVLGSIVLIVFLIAIYMYWRRRQNRSKTILREINTPVEETNKKKIVNLNVLKGNESSHESSTKKQKSQSTTDPQSSENKKIVTHVSRRTTKHRSRGAAKSTDTVEKSKDSKGRVTTKTTTEVHTVKGGSQSKDSTAKHGTHQKDSTAKGGAQPKDHTHKTKVGSRATKTVVTTKTTKEQK